MNSGDAALVADKASKPASIEAFSGMVFGEKQIQKKDVVKTNSGQSLARNEDEEAEADNDVPIWWMLAALVILGVTF
ncbi:MAG: hypothetical protein OEY11_15670 [Gammaproteobacteria bacterium]|nr:hypothetical protein [Gammaproteobacteria bacterium]